MAQAPTPAKETKASSGEVMTVGCKLPHGLHLDITDDGKPRARVTVLGTNSSKIIGGYGITENVPADHFNEWLKRNASLPAVVNGLIFAHEEARSVAAKAREMSKERSGFEPIEPSKMGKDITALTRD